MHSSRAPRDVEARYAGEAEGLRRSREGENAGLGRFQFVDGSFNWDDDHKIVGVQDGF